MDTQIEEEIINFLRKEVFTNETKSNPMQALREM